MWPFRKKPEPSPIPKPVPKGNNVRQALSQIAAKPKKSYLYPIKPPELAPGVIPETEKAAPVAMDSAAYGYAQATYGGNVSGFPGYPYLANLATRAEYRNFAGSLSTEETREWIVLNSFDTDDAETAKRITELTQALKDLEVQKVMRKAFEHDCYYGHGQIFVKIYKTGNLTQDQELPLILSDKTIPKGTRVSFKNIEPMWTSPSAYNAQDPTADDFYIPREWYVLGKKTHATRLLSVITREVPDMLKPAFNFGGISLSQLAEYYVDEWLRTKTSISNLLDTFSITALKTDMSAVLQSGEDDGTAAGDVFARAELFTAMRSNQGLMLLDKESEELEQLNTPLGGLHELQAQAQEHLCSVSREPAIILTGVSPSGLNASSDGEIRVFYDWISALQEAYGRPVLEIIIKIIQLSMYGEIDPKITFTFQPLYQMTPKELAEIRKSDADAANIYVQTGAVDPEEVRDKIARDPESGWQGLEMGISREPNEDD